MLSGMHCQKCLRKKCVLSASHFTRLQHLVYLIQKFETGASCQAMLFLQIALVTVLLKIVLKETAGQTRKGSGHRVGRVLSFSPVVGIGPPPTFHPQASVPPPPFVRGERHTRWRERGWESPNSDEGTCTVVLLYICTLWVRGKIEMSKEFQLLSVSRAALQSVGLLRQFQEIECSNYLFTTAAVTALNLLAKMQSCDTMKSYEILGTFLLGSAGLIVEAIPRDRVQQLLVYHCCSNSAQIISENVVLRYHAILRTSHLFFRERRTNCKQEMFGR